MVIEPFHGGAAFIINVLIIKLRDHPSLQLMVLSFINSSKRSGGGSEAEGCRPHLIRGLERLHRSFLLNIGICERLRSNGLGIWLSYFFFFPIFGLSDTFMLLQKNGVKVTHPKVTTHSFI